jgi:hypothetical protein
VKVALKEWDAVTRAALSGGTALLIRKGGILEQRDGFSAEHTTFWLYPTFLHQNRAEMRYEFQTLLEENLNPSEVRLEGYCMVERVWKVEDLELARALEGLNALTADAIERRFLYKNKPWVHALLLRVQRCEPQTILETPSYAGCTSWVPLEEDVLVVNGVPAMNDLEFGALKRELEAMLGK